MVGQWPIISWIALKGRSLGAGETSLGVCLVFCKYKCHRCPLIYKKFPSGITTYGLYDHLSDLWYCLYCFLINFVQPNLLNVTFFISFRLQFSSTHGFSSVILLPSITRKDLMHIPFLFHLNPLSVYFNTIYRDLVPEHYVFAQSLGMIVNYK